MADIHLGVTTGKGPNRTIEVFYHVPGPSEEKTLAALSDNAADAPAAPQIDAKELEALSAGTLLEIRETQSYGEEPKQMAAAHEAMRARWKQLSAERPKRIQAAYASYGTTLSAKT